MLGLFNQFNNNVVFVLDSNTPFWDLNGIGPVASECHHNSSCVYLSDVVCGGLVALIAGRFALLLGVITVLHCTTLHYTTLHYTTLHCTTPHYATLRYATLRYAMLRYATLRYATLR